MEVDLASRCTALEHELRIKESQFQGVFDTSSIGMAIVGLNGQWIKVNSTLLKMLGYEREQLYHLSFQDLTHPDDLGEDLHLLDELVSGHISSYQLEKRYFDVRGNIVWGLLSVSIVRDENKKPLHFVSQILDITESKRLNHQRVYEMDRKANDIAYELHENIAQTLASIKLFLASSRARKIYEGTDLMGVDRKLTTLIGDIQLLTEQIVPTTFLNENIHSLIHGLATRHALQREIHFDVSVDDYAKGLVFPATYNLFKIVADQVQSALLRNATEISIDLRKTDALILQLSDNGDVEKPVSGSRIALLVNNIQTRVEMLNGVIRNSADIYQRNVYSILIPLAIGEHSV